MMTRLATLCCLIATAMTLAACSRQRDPSTPEEAAKRGDELLRKMSDTLKSAPSLSFSVSESHERMQRNGQKEPYTLKREVMVRRPDRLGAAGHRDRPPAAQQVDRPGFDQALRQRARAHDAALDQGDVGPDRPLRGAHPLRHTAAPISSGRCRACRALPPARRCTKPARA